MIVAISQYKVKTLKSFQQFKDHLEWHVHQAAEQNAELLLLPEFFTSELLTLQSDHTYTGNYQPIFEHYAKAYTDEIKSWCSNLSNQYQLIVAAGTHFVYEENEDKYYNTSFVFNPDGQIFSQSKVHPSYELVYNKAMTSPAQDIDVFETNKGRLGVSICYDTSFPEVSRILSKLGADMILVPTCTLDTFGSERNTLFARARASENQVFVLNSQLIGSIAFPSHLPYGFTFTGVSGIYGPIHPLMAHPNGLIASCEPNVETVISAELDLDYLREVRNTGHNQNRKDMRPDFYKKFL